MKNIEQNRQEYVEEMAVFFETLGLTRMAGRIQGYIMTSQEELVCFDELVEGLRASKSSISTNLKSLQTIMFIKAVTKPGDRKTYFCLTPDMDWTLYYKNRITAMYQMNNLFRKGLDFRLNQDDKTSKWIYETVEFFEWVAGEISKKMEEWKGKVKNEE